MNNVNFYYRINNSSWAPVNGNKITFSELSDKKYSIDFIARNFNGNTSEIKNFSFQVKPPFWRNKFSKFIYFALLLVIIVYILLKIAQLKNVITLKNRQLAKEINEKIELLQKNIEL